MKFPKIGHECRVLACSVVALAVASGLASAAEKTAESTSSNSVLPEVIITSQFRAENVQATPIAVTAVNAAMIDSRGQTSIYELANQAPNVTLKPQPQNSGIGLVAFIRGIGQTDFNYALEPGVGIYVDDVYIPTLSSSLLELMDLDRVEILRGPQGTLAGKNSIGGAIKVFSAKPKGDGSGTVQATYGSYDRIDVRGMADFAITDNLFARVSGMTKSQKGYVTVLDYGLTHPGSVVPGNNNSGKHPGILATLGGTSISAARMALRWLPSDKLEINFSTDYTRERDDSGAEVLLQTVSTLADGSPTKGAIATNADGMPWLMGTDGSTIPVDCRFVPYGPYSCDTTPAGYNPKFINYSNFLDGLTPTTQAPFKPYAAIPGNDYDGYGFMGNVKYNFTDSLQLTWISSYRHYYSTWGMDQDASPVPESQLNQTLHHRAWSQEVRLNGDFLDKKLEYTVGGFWFDQNGTLNARVDLNYAGIDFIHGPDTTPSTSKAAFINATFHITDAWSLSAGARYSKDKKTYTYYRSNPDGSVPSAPCAFFLGAATAGPTGIGNDPNCLLVGLYNTHSQFKGTRWDWRAVTNYQFTDDIMAYASVSTGYMGGGVNPRPFYGESAPGGSCLTATYSLSLPPVPCNQELPFKPETLTTYEIGFKADLLDRRLRLNGAAFYNKFNDIILTLSHCPDPRLPCILPANVGKADVKGVEMETTFYLTDNLSFDGDISYINFKYKDTGTSGVPLTARTPYTPTVTGAFGVQYDAMLQKGMVSFRFDGSYQGSFFTEAFNTPLSKVDSHFLGNARITYRSEDDKWQIALEVQNIFDKYYMLTKSDISTSLGQVTGQPGMPRTWAVTVKRNF